MRLPNLSLVAATCALALGASASSAAVIDFTDGTTVITDGTIGIGSRAVAQEIVGGTTFTIELNATAGADSRLPASSSVWAVSLTNAIFHSSLRTSMVSSLISVPIR